MRASRSSRAGLYVGMQHLGVDAGIATVVALAAGFSMRMLAVRLGWKMRTFGATDLEH